MQVGLELACLVMCVRLGDGAFLDSRFGGFTRQVAVL